MKLLALRAIATAIIGLALCAAAMPVRAQRPGGVVVLDRVVAVINDEVITRLALEERLKAVTLQLQRQGTPPPPRVALEKQVLERMITSLVQLQYAKEGGLRVDDGQLDKTIARIAEDNKMSLAALRAALEKDGVTFSRFREDIRDEMVISRLREREIDNKVVITESEVENYLKSQDAQSGNVDEYNLSHILIRVPEQASPEQIQERRARAEQVLAQIKSGADFRQIAASFSDAPDAVSGGAMGWREAGRLPTIFAEAVKDLKPGEVSAILRSPNGFHVLRLNERRGQSAPLFVQQTHVRHILIKTNELVSESEAKGRLAKLKERLDNNADFAELARIHSEDASAARGGDLGWLLPGDTVPEFERAMNALQPGQISEPVQSPFGWHLIQVLERRTQDMSQEQQRLRARLALRERKAEEAYQEWVRQLRDRAFIEYRLEEK